jgi:hypothetical protein
MVVIKDICVAFIVKVVRIKYVKINLVDKYENSARPKVDINLIESRFILSLSFLPSLSMYFCLLSLKNKKINIEL